MYFSTANSTYEVDRANKRIRRLDGVKTATKRVGVDGEWRTYADLLVAVTLPAIIEWPASTPLLDGSPEGSSPCTFTSPVIDVIE
jgi:hypothetical protein